MGSNFRQIRLLTMELAALEHLKHQCLHFFLNKIDHGTLDSGERSLPFGLHVFYSLDGWILTHC